MKRLPFLNILLLALLLAACTTAPAEAPPSPTATLNPGKVDSGLVYGQPCKAPCWFGMIPGKTTAQEIQEMMLRLSTMESPYDFLHDEGDIPFVIQTRSDITEHMSISLKLDHDGKILQAIHSSYLTFDYSLGQLIAQFGEPEVVVVLNPNAAERSCDDWAPSNGLRTGNSIGQILYPELGLYFTVYIPMSGYNLLCPEMLVESFCYYPPMTLQEAMTNNRLADLCGVKLFERITKKNLVKWHGFGGGY